MAEAADRAMRCNMGVVLDAGIVIDHGTHIDNDVAADAGAGLNDSSRENDGSRADLRLRGNEAERVNERQDRFPSSRQFFEKARALIILADGQKIIIGRNVTP